MKAASRWGSGQRRALIALSVAFIGCGGSGSSPPGGGCGENCPPPSKAEFLYAATSSGGTQIFPIDSSTGVLGSPVSQADPQYGPLAATPAGTYLYGIDVTAQTIDHVAIAVTGSSIDPATGALAPVPGSPFGVFSGSSISSVSSLAVEPSGQLLYAFESVGGSIHGFTIESSGALAPVSQLPVEASARLLATDSVGKFLFGCWASSFVAYSIDSNDGTLTPVSGSPFQFPTFSSGAEAFVVHPNGHFLYVTMFSNTVAGLSVAADGALGLVSGSPLATGNNPVNMAVDPLGRFLYVANNGDGTISGFNVDPNTGVLTSIAGSPFSAGTNSAGLPRSPYDLVIDSRGKFLYVSDNNNAAVLTFRIASTGALVKQPDTSSLMSTSFLSLVEEN